MRAEGCVALMRGLVHNRTLVRSENKRSGSSGSALLTHLNEAAATRPSLTGLPALCSLLIFFFFFSPSSLDLSYHGIRNAGCLALCDVMQQAHCGLRFLCLQKNHIQHRGAVQIARSVLHTDCTLVGGTVGLISLLFLCSCAHHLRLCMLPCLFVQLSAGAAVRFDFVVLVDVESSVAAARPLVQRDRLARTGSAARVRATGGAHRNECDAKTAGAGAGSGAGVVVRLSRAVIGCTCR